jgi:hypothetical protein
MKFTNEYGLPESLVGALKNDDYDLKDVPLNIISVTAAIAPPKIRTLELRHWDEIEVDVSERMWSVVGRAVHHVLEGGANKSGLCEERWYIDVNTWEVHTISNQRIQDMPYYNSGHMYLSGKLDSFEEATMALQDYKLTSVWSWLIEKAPKPEHVSQLNFNALALHLLGFEVKELQIIMMFKDWSASKVERDYPSLKIPMLVVKAPKWDYEHTKKIILERIQAHNAARSMKSDDDIPECLPVERWDRPTTYAVIKGANKRALRVHDSKEQAEVHLAQCGKDHRIEVRFGGSIRCEGYCSVNRFCHFYKAKYNNKE